jgi:hypothetical protein
MRKLIGGLGVLALLMLVLGSAGAQDEKKGRREGGRRGGRGGGMGASFMLLNPRVQEELKLTDDQKEKIRAAAKKFDSEVSGVLNADQKKELQEMRERFGRGRRGPGEGGPGRRGGGRGPGGEGGGRGPGGGDRPPLQYPSPRG